MRATSRAGIVSILLLVGCGRLGFDALGGAANDGDASVGEVTDGSLEEETTEADTGAGCQPVACAVTEGTSCQDILQACTCPPSGTYLIDPDGPDGQPSFSAYCEMQEDGGGWTLAMKIDGTQPTFTFDSTAWTDQTTIGASSPDLDMTEAKLESYTSLSFTELRLGMVEGGGTRWVIVPIAATSLYDLISPGTHTATAVGEQTWRSLVSSPSLQTSCSMEGINSTIPANNTTGARVRIGVAANDSNCGGKGDSYLGFGGTVESCFGDPSISAGNVAGCSPDSGDRNTAVFGYVMIR